IGEAQLHHPECTIPRVYAWRHWIPDRRFDGSGRSPHRDELCWAVIRNGFACQNWPLAGAFGGCRYGDCDSVSLRPESGIGAVAMDQLGERVRCAWLGDRLDPVLLVYDPLWQLQQDVRFPRRGVRVHDLDLAVRDGDPGWSRNRRRNGASDRARYDDGS